MGYRYYICDVFTDTRFGGNQLAVLPEAAGLSDRQMQQIAREFNFSESTFVLPPEAGHDRRVRIFTPSRRGPLRRAPERRHRLRPGGHRRARAARPAGHRHVRGEGGPGADHDHPRRDGSSGASCRRPSALARPGRSRAELLAAAVSLAPGRRGHHDPSARRSARSACRFLWRSSGIGPRSSGRGPVRASMRSALGMRPTSTSTSGAATSSISAPACSRRSTACPRIRPPAAPTARWRRCSRGYDRRRGGSLPLAHRAGRRDGAAQRARGPEREARRGGRGDADRRARACW